MGKNLVSDSVILPLQKTLKSFCAQTGYTEDSVFEGLLDYMIGFLNPSLTPEPNPAWKFKSEENEVFHDMMFQVIEITRDQIPKKGWYDPFGDLYMVLHSAGGGKEQYFTPASVASAVAGVNMHGMTEPKGSWTPMGQRIVISDPAGGSGRMALAGYCELLKVMQNEWGWDARYTEAHRPYISVEDLDYNCVKMAALNICLHSAYGEAICHNTLTEPDVVRVGYIVGEADWPFPTGIPSVRKELNPMRFATTRHWIQCQVMKTPTDRKEPQDVLPIGGGVATEVRESEQSQESGVSDFTHEKSLSDTVQVKEKKEAVQLTLW